MIELEDNRLFVTDFASTNGTRVNGEQVDVKEIIEGDLLEFGMVKFSIMRDLKPLPTDPDSDQPTLKCQYPPVSSEIDPAISRLSPALRRVLYLVARGYSEERISKELFLSYNTIHNHTRAIRRIYGVASRGELQAKVAYLLQPVAERQ
jgi:DNA-binding CsgD family transcriptional regulator